MAQDTRTEGRLTGRHILITGAASGIGRATALRFAAEGAKLALLDRDEARLAEVVRETGGFGVTVDLADEQDIKRAVAESAVSLRQIDGIVNVAGIGGGTFVETMTTEVWNHILAVNLTAPFIVCREAIPHLKKAGFGTIVNVSSGQGLLPSVVPHSAYCASKGGLIVFSKSLAQELAPLIRVNAICPGVVDTPLLPATMKEAAKLPGSAYALRRVGTAEEIAAGILFLSSAESSFMTGTALSVDGGRAYH